jgi:hypothetical protein
MRVSVVVSRSDRPLPRCRGSPLGRRVEDVAPSERRWNQLYIGLLGFESGNGCCRWAIQAVFAFTCVTSTSADSKRLGQRHRLGLLVERSKPDVTRALTRDLLHTTSHKLETYKLHSRPSAALESSSAANSPSTRTRNNRRKAPPQWPD